MTTDSITNINKQIIRTEIPEICSYRYDHVIYGYRDSVLK